jgi:hypothetical protein
LSWLQTCFGSKEVVAIADKNLVEVALLLVNGAFSNENPVLLIFRNKLR